MALFLALLLAAPSGHRALAAQAEALGHMRAAAREYEAAWREEHAPDLLYRLGVVRRKLKQYGLAREALRAYLRDAPEGGLRDEVLRQLAKLDVLIEARNEDYSEVPPVHPPRESPKPQPAPRGLANSPSPTQSDPPPPMPASPPAASAAAANAISAQINPPPTTASQPQPAGPSPVTAPNPISAQINPRPMIALPPEASPSPSPSPFLFPFPSAQTRPRLTPYLLAASAASASAGAYLWWDGARLSASLDTRFSHGDLAAADSRLYSRSHTASLAGRALVALSAGLLAAAVALW